MNSLNLVGISESHSTILDRLKKVAATDAEILITGPSGVGKELYANYVHLQSHRKNHHFVPVNCGSLSSGLLENELFGHIGGAFTGAMAQSEGLVNEAEGGTLFFDEVDSLSMTCQIKLLRFLQDKQYRRLGENYLRQANVRILAATNVDLEATVQEGQFRKDLFFRLRVVPIEIPPLNHRPEDILELLKTFSEKYAKKYNLPRVKFSEMAIERMKTYDWPGNIRELENCVAFLTCLQPERVLEPGDLPLLNKIQSKNGDSETSTPDRKNNDGLDPREYVGFQESKSRLIANFEKEYIQQILKCTNGNISAAARMSGKNRRALFELMQKNDIDANEFRLK